MKWDTPENVRHSIRVICDEEGLSVQDKNILCAVIQCESGFNTQAKHVNEGGTTDWGIAQYNDKYYIGPGKPIASVDEALNNPEKCVRVMIRQMKAGLLKHWVCFSSGKYKKYLNAPAPVTPVIPVTPPVSAPLPPPPPLSPPPNPPPYVQKILIIQNGVIAKETTSLLKEWFEKLGIPTSTEIVSDSSSFKFVTLPGVPGKIANPEEVKVIASRYIKGDHFVLFCYKGSQNTPMEFSELFLGTNIIQIPILSVSTPEYVCEYMVHEILHGWYARLVYNGIFLTDDVHSHAFTDARPEANYSAIVEKLKPHAAIIFRPITVPEQINFLRKAIDGFIALLNSFFR